MIEKIVLYDGVCGLCDGYINFLIKRDPKKTLKFASLQSAAGQRILKERSIPYDLNTMVFIEGDETYTFSTAFLRSVSALGCPYSPLLGLLAVPAVIRDWCYSTFAQYRYRLFGQFETCKRPNADLLSRFLPDGIAAPSAESANSDKSD